MAIFFDYNTADFVKATIEKVGRVWVNGSFGNQGFRCRKTCLCRKEGVVSDEIQLILSNVIQIFDHWKTHTKINLQEVFKVAKTLLMDFVYYRCSDEEQQRFSDILVAINPRLHYSAGKYRVQDNLIILSEDMLYIPEEYVVFVAYHELLHIKYFNHGKAFKSVMKQFPDHDKMKSRFLGLSMFFELKKAQNEAAFEQLVNKFRVLVKKSD